MGLLKIELEQILFFFLISRLNAREGAEYHIKENLRFFGSDRGIIIGGRTS